MVPVAISSFIWSAMDGSLSKFSTEYLPYLRGSPIALLSMLYLAMISTGWTAYQEQRALQQVSAAEVYIHFHVHIYVFIYVYKYRMLLLFQE